MVDFEKVEILVQKTNVSYEDAKIALEAANGDMLDAIIALEKQGKVNGPAQGAFTTNTQQTQYKNVSAVIEETEQKDSKAKSFFRDLGGAIKRGFQYTIDNSVRVIRNDNEIIRLPLWMSIILMLAAWHLLIIVIIISFFLDCRYSLVGKDNANDVNKVINQAADFAGRVKTSFNESFNSGAADQTETQTEVSQEAAVQTEENVATAEENVVEGEVVDGSVSDVQ